MTRTACPHRRGFSLIELLVVIGIIVILIGILIPVIRSVRESAWNTDSMNTIRQISDAATRYSQDHNNAYPGIFSNDQIRVGIEVKANRDFDAGTTSPITMSENLVLSLVGGTEFNGSSPSGLKYDAQALRSSRGVVGANPANPKRWPAYITATERMLSFGQMSDTDPGNSNVQAQMDDSVIPEFLDTWPEGDQLPIIYLRARNGASGIISLNGAPAAYQYDLGYLAPYIRTSGSKQDSLQDLGTWTQAIDDSGGDDNALAYFKHPTGGGTDNATGTPREKDRFVLIAAGKDRLYGTTDDIVSWGNR